MRRVLDLSRDRGTDNWVLDYGEAQFAALSGDVDQALTRMESAYERGLVGVNFFDEPLFQEVRSDPRYNAFDDKMSARVDAERAVLGLPPYQSLVQDDRRPSFVN